jgi:hypothetical protein
VTSLGSWVLSGNCPINKSFFCDPFRIYERRSRFSTEKWQHWTSLQHRTKWTSPILLVAINGSHINFSLYISSLFIYLFIYFHSFLCLCLYFCLFLTLFVSVFNYFLICFCFPFLFISVVLLSFCLTFPSFFLSFLCLFAPLYPPFLLCFSLFTFLCLLSLLLFHPVFFTLCFCYFPSLIFLSSLVYFYLPSFPYSLPTLYIKVKVKLSLCFF